MTRIISGKQGKIVGRPGFKTMKRATGRISPRRLFKKDPADATLTDQGLPYTFPVRFKQPAEMAGQPGAPTSVSGKRWVPGGIQKLYVRARNTNRRITRR